MKKILSIALVLVMCATLLPVVAGEPVTVKFWSHINEAWNDSYEQLIAEFEEANPDIKIEYQTYPYDDFEAKIQTSLMAGASGADVYEVWGGWMLDFAAQGVLSETPAAFVADLEEDAYAPVLGALKHDGKYYGAPIEFNIEYGGIVVNKKLYEEAGLSYPTTWDQLIEDAKKVSVSDGEAMIMRGFGYANYDTLTANFLALILQSGGQYLNEDGSVDFTSPEAVAAMKQLVGYTADDHINNLDSLTNQDTQEDHMMVALDECFGCVRGPWVLSDIEQSYGLTMGVDYDYISQPTFYEGVDPKFAAETGWSLCVPKNTEVEEAAWRFVEFLNQPDVMLRHNIACTQVPARRSVAQDPDYVAGARYMEPLLDKLQYAQFIGPFNTDILKTYIMQTFMNLVTGDHSDEAVQAACVKLTEDLAKDMNIY
ncbi:MAG: ABC transporter substrate-binding protein [Christensenellales bacterium]|jgi:multiple sugar transport system substrate-binding protein